MASLLEGKVLTGVLGVFVPVIGWVGAVRLAEPDSWWNRMEDLVGGAPDAG